MPGSPFLGLFWGPPNFDWGKGNVRSGGPYGGILQNMEGTCFLAHPLARPLCHDGGLAVPFRYSFESLLTGSSMTPGVMQRVGNWLGSQGESLGKPERAVLARHLPQLVRGYVSWRRRYFYRSPQCAQLGRPWQIPPLVQVNPNELWCYAS